MTALRAPTRTFLAVSALSSTGNGLTFPVSALYLERVRELPLDSAPLFFAAMAIAGALTSLSFGRAMDRRGPRPFVVLGMMSEAVGLTLFAIAPSVEVVAVAGVLIGGGNGLFFTGLTPLLASLESGLVLDRAFSIRYWLINLGNAIGALIGGSLVAIAGVHALQPAYFANAATSVCLAATLAWIPVHARRDDHAEEKARLRWNRTFVALAAGNALIVVFGMAMFEAVVPYVFVGSRDASVPLAHAIVGASTLAIIVGQLPLGRWVERRKKARAMMLNTTIWAAAAVIGIAAMGVHGTIRWELGIAYGVAFGIGECLFSASLQPLVVRVVPATQLARFNGVLSASYSAALAIGPALGFGLVARTSPHAFWTVVTVAMLAATWLWSYVARSEPA